ncbi:hypothetical protein BC937DRAFT_86753 [Endogone sp. FLAS-F59071]|nr:hypothetical protein BC937DRAFT_86753 [Endogone sp. FLAS-F59071]|eukprot:RUS12895.1 hypothetical protein BC937DRAFT_86753 [Endogone sp. FLAS-F59071]
MALTDPVPGEPLVSHLSTQRRQLYFSSTDLGAPLGACLGTCADGMDGLVTPFARWQGDHSLAVPLAQFTTLPIAETLKSNHTLPALPLTVWWSVFDHLRYSECWKLTSVDKLMRANILSYMEMVLRRKLRTGRWSFLLETELCLDICADPETYFSGIFPHFDRRTLDLCLDLRAIGSAHANIMLPGGKAHTDRSTCLGLDVTTTYTGELHTGWIYHQPGTTHPLELTPHYVSLCLTLRRFPEAVDLGRRATFVEWLIGRGYAETMFGFEDKKICGQERISKGRIAKVKVKVGAGLERTIAHAVYEEAHWNYSGRGPRRGGVEFTEVKFVPPVLFETLERMHV